MPGQATLVRLSFWTGSNLTDTAQLQSIERGSIYLENMNIEAEFSSDKIYFL